ncbi:MAG: DUF6265 family protein [Bacteroidales bacterium]
MKKNLFLLVILSVSPLIQCFSQSFPLFLQGTWKIGNNEAYEHWDKVSDSKLLGFAYLMKNGQMNISEYLEIEQRGNEVIYTATVLNHNKGKGVEYILTQTDSTYSFENAKHDFPKFIKYKPVSTNKISVSFGSDEKNFSFNYLRFNGEETKN